MSRKKIIKPQYVKNNQGKTTHVYLSIDSYNAIIKDVEAYKKIQAKEGVRWVAVSSHKKGKKKKI